MAALEKFSHVASTTVSSGGTTAPAAGTSETWTVASSASFPAAETGVIKFKVVDPAANTEVIEVTNVSGTTWTVTRGADGTTPVPHTAGFTVRNILSAKSMASVIANAVSVFNVLDYGAKGDDSNADHVGIQAALDDAYLNGGGVVLVPKGIYRIMTNPIRIRENIQLKCEPGAVIKRYWDGTSMVWNGDGAQSRSGYTGNGNFIIEGGLWDMRATTSTISLAADTFDRANTAAPHKLGTSSGGGVWQVQTGSLGINTNLAYAPTAQTNISTLAGFQDGTVSVTTTTVSGTEECGLVFRLHDSDNYWYYRRGSDGNAKLAKIVNRTETVITPDATVAVANGSVLKVVMYGSRIRCYVGSTLTHDETDAQWRSENRHGIIINGTASRLDTFSISSSIWTDDFNRTNSTTSLGTSSSGLAWTTQSGTLGINTNLAYAPTAGNNWATLDATSESNVKVTVSTVGNAGLIFRYKDNNNYWYYRRHTDGNARLGKVVGGVETVITPDATVAVAAGNVMDVEILGWLIRAHTNGTMTHDFTDSDLYQESKVGIQILDTAARLDTFEAWAASGSNYSGACFNLGHAESVTIRDLTVKDNSSLSHAVELCAVKNALVDNCRFLGMALLSGRDESEAIQLDLAKGSNYFGAFGPHDHTPCEDITVTNCYFGGSGSSGVIPWGRGIGSHSSTIGKWHRRISVTDNNFDDLGGLAVRAYNWEDVVISGNLIGSCAKGIEVRSVDVSGSDPADTMDENGTQTNASQPITNIVISDNVIRQTTTASTGHGIYVIGEATGTVNNSIIEGNTLETIQTEGIYVVRADGMIIRGNAVKDAGGNGLRLDTLTDSRVTDNVVDTPGNHGIYCASGTDVSISGNSVQMATNHGVYVTGAGTARISVSDNYVRGASRGTNLTSSCYMSDSTPTDCSWVGNQSRLVGSGNEPIYGLRLNNGSHYVEDNNVEGGTAAYNIASGVTRKGSKLVAALSANVGSLTSTTLADVSGLSVTIPAAGKYRFFANLTMTAASTSDVRRIVPTGPTASMICYTVSYQTTTAGATTTVMGADWGAGGPTSTAIFPSTTTPVATQVWGLADFTATGVFKLQYAVGSGDTMTIRAGSAWHVERVD